MGEVINISNSLQVVAACPECGCQVWYIHVDRIGSWNNILEFECGNANCAFIIRMGKVKVIDVGEIDESKESS